MVDVWIPLLLSLLAGLATGFGSLITVSFKGVSSLAWIINIGVAANMIMAASLFLTIKRHMSPAAKG